MSLLTFLLETVLISLSGVMAPGPITAVAVGKGNESPHAGVGVALGHGIVEFPLVMLISYGFGQWINLPFVKTAVALAGGLLLLFMGVGMLRSLRQVEVDSAIHNRWRGRFPVGAGALLSLGNPFVLIWWATVGAALILRAARFGLGGLLAFAVVHWSCDLIWCYFLSALSFKGGRFFGLGFQKVVFVACGLFLLSFGGKYLFEVVRVFFV